VGQHAVKGAGVVGDEPDMKPALPVARVDLRVQAGDDVRRYFLI
jgi:uncharacterized protein affecting Mg2+/Co2+ transport